ncbi:MAG: acyl-CoA thioesterase [Bacteroidia bacterium]|nr:acyl-CoA thioesterase [Bacteroidia bacterium]
MNELKEEIALNVRFSDTDAMGVIWHGNYLKFFEDAREAFGNKFGLTYLDVYNCGYFTPIVKSEIDFKSPIYYGEKVTVIAKYIPVPAAKIIFEYRVMNLSTNKVCAIGKTIQVFINEKTRILELNKPDFYLAWELKNEIKF